MHESYALFDFFMANNVRFINMACLTVTAVGEFTAQTQNEYV